MSAESRFWEKVLIAGPAECWLWQAKRRAGYGEFWGWGRWVRAHRFSYELVHGTVPAGLHVLHSCDTPACVNQAHLSVGTREDNMRQASAAGHLAHPHHGNAPRRLTDGERMAIEAALRAGKPVRAIARECGVATPSIRYIRARMVPA